jgi:glutamine amidotransferase
MKIGVIDYQAGNLGSLSSALSEIELDYFVSDNPNEIKKSDLILIPGVGSLSSGMHHIRKTGLDETILEHHRGEKPILGICLGMHLLGTSGDEGGETQGLNLIAGRITKLVSKEGFRVPHMGWDFVNNNGNSTYGYFAHSFYFNMLSKAKLDLVSSFNWGTENLPAEIRYNNVGGIQYHPEKSGPSGLKVLSQTIQYLSSVEK